MLLPTIVKYEVKSLMRSGLVKLLPVYFLFGIFLTFMESYFRSSKYLASWIPYNISVHLTTLQSFPIILLVADLFCSGERKHAVQSIYARSFSNLAYVAGKSIAVITIISFFTAVYTAIVLGLQNVLLQETPVNPLLYVAYPLILNVPACIFLTGLSVFVVSVLKDHRLSLLILLGFVITVYSDVSVLHLGYFDFRGVNLPMIYSDFIGFGGIEGIITHRMIFIAMGCAFFLFNPFFLWRLPQRKLQTIIMPVIASVILASGIYTGIQLISGRNTEIELRQNMRTLDSSVSHLMNVSITDCDLSIDHEGKEISAVCKLDILNSNESNLDTLIFSLNPGLNIESLSLNGEPRQFTRQLHHLMIIPEKPLTSGETGTLEMTYVGMIDDAACYYSIPEYERDEANTLHDKPVGKRYSFVTPRFVLLTKESMWYPVPGIVDIRNPQREFANYSLKVHTDESLTVISQGKEKIIDTGIVSFTPEYPLPQISLTIGRYIKRSIQVDDVEYSFYLHKKNQRVNKLFQDIDTEMLGEVITSMREKTKFDLNRDYPFRRFATVETPLQFYAYDFPTSPATASQQPEQVFVEERLINRRFSSREAVLANTRINSQALTPKEIDRMRLSTIVIDNYLTIDERTRINRKARKLYGKKIYLGKTYAHAVDIAPNYYEFTNAFESDGSQFIDLVFSLYYRSKLKHNSDKQGMEDRDTITSQLLSASSLYGILTGDFHESDCYDILTCKSNEFYTRILDEIEISDYQFQLFIDEYLSENAFKKVSIESFFQAIQKRYNKTVAFNYDTWLHTKGLPVYEIIDKKNVYSGRGRSRRYQITFTAANHSVHNGVITVRLFGKRGDPEIISSKKIIHLEGGQAKRVAFETKKPYEVIYFDFGVSHQIPSRRTFYIGKPASGSMEDILNGEIVLDDYVVEKNENEIIVDDSDDSFEVIHDNEKHFWDKYFVKPKAQNHLTTTIPYQASPTWTPVINHLFYGVTQSTAYYIRKGTGKNRVAWKASLPEKGKYDLLYYNRYYFMNTMRTHSQVKDFHFTVYMQDGPVELVLDEGKNYGWAYLSTFDLNAGEVIVELSDETSGHIVYADAIKWVKKTDE